MKVMRSLIAVLAFTFASFTHAVIGRKSAIVADT